MKQLVIPKPGSIVVRDAEMPVPQKGEALLRMLYGGICGSDLGVYRGTFAYGGYPRVPGHEIAAEIVEIEPNGRGLAPGMPVTVNPYFNCGACYSCRRGLVNCCTGNQTMGAQRDGAFSEYFAIPAERVYSGDGLAPKTLALVEPTCISYHGARLADIQKGDRVLVIGSGAIGILAAACARHFGAEVYVSDISAGKLEYAKAMGASGVILNDSPEALPRAVAAITGGDGFDVTIEAAGTAATFRQCVDSAAFGARIVVIGISKQRLDFDFTVIQKKELRIYGSRNARKEDFEAVIGLFKSGAILPEKIVSDVFDAESAVAAFEKLDKRGDEALKILLRF